VSERDYSAAVEIDGIMWRARLIPLESIRVTRAGVDIGEVTWDRQTLCRGQGRSWPLPREITVALRDAIRAREYEQIAARAKERDLE
jgi:hypothetical protein